MASAYRPLSPTTYVSKKKTPLSGSRALPYLPWQQGFTYYGTSNIELQIRRDLKEMADLITRRLKAKNISALIISGRYGRGEAGMALSPSGHETLIEKYPISVVIKNTNFIKYNILKQRFLDVVDNTKLSSRMHMRFVSFFSVKELRVAAPTLANFHLKWGHHVFWGDKKIFHLLRIGHPIPFHHSEALRLLLQQAYRMTVIKRRLFLNNCKATDLIRTLYETIFVCGNAFLILKDAYASSYMQRSQNLNTLEENIDFLRERHFAQQYWRAVQFFFKPYTMMKLKHVKDMMADVFSLYEDFYKYSISAYVRRTIDTDEHFIRILTKGALTHEKQKVSMFYPFYHVYLMGFSGFRGKWKYFHPTCRLYAATLGVLLDETQGKGKLIRFADHSLGLTRQHTYVNRSSAYIRLWRDL